MAIRAVRVARTENRDREPSRHHMRIRTAPGPREGHTGTSLAKVGEAAVDVTKTRIPTAADKHAAFGGNGAEVVLTENLPSPAPVRNAIKRVNQPREGGFLAILCVFARYETVSVVTCRISSGRPRSRSSEEPLSVCATNRPPHGAPSREETTLSESSRPSYRDVRADRPTSRTETRDTIHAAVELIRNKYDVALTTAYTTLVQASADLSLTVRETAARIVDESLETADPGTWLHARSLDD